MRALLLTIAVWAAAWFWVRSSPNPCEMTYSSPQMLSTCSPSVWQLTPRQGGPNVLFVPGNRGHWRQARSLAAWSDRTPLKSRDQTPTWYSLDVGDDASAIVGSHLERQAASLRRAMQCLQPGPTTIVAHSAGLLVALAALSGSNTDETDSSHVFSPPIRLVAIGAPLRGPPLFLSPRIAWHTMRAYRRTIHNIVTTGISLSIAGGLRDVMVPEALTRPGPMLLDGALVQLQSTQTEWWSATTDLGDSFTAAGGVDHLALLWCAQVVQPLAAAIARNESLIADATTTTASSLSSITTTAATMMCMWLANVWIPWMVVPLVLSLVTGSLVENSPLRGTVVATVVGGACMVRWLALHAYPNNHHSGLMQQAADAALVLTDVIAWLPEMGWGAGITAAGLAVWVSHDLAQRLPRWLIVSLMAVIAWGERLLELVIDGPQLTILWQILMDILVVLAMAVVPLRVAGPAWRPWAAAALAALQGRNIWLARIAVVDSLLPLWE